jgi:hypothetical protein
MAWHSTSLARIMFDPRRAWPAQWPQPLAVKMLAGAWIIPSAWSPDSRLLAGNIATASGSSIDICVYDVAARTVRTVYADPSPVFGFAWLGDNRRLIYAFADSLWPRDLSHLGAGRTDDLRRAVATAGESVDGGAERQAAVNRRLSGPGDVRPRWTGT